MQNGSEKNVKTRFFAKMPNTMVILFAVLLFACLLTWLLPAGEFDKITDPQSGKVMSDPTSFHYVDKKPANLLDLFTAVPKGFQASASVVSMIVIAAGAMGVINATGAVERALKVILKKAGATSAGARLFVLMLLMYVFSVIGFVCGPEMMIPFVGLAISISIGLGYDIIVGLSLLMAANIGYATFPYTAATIGVAHEITGLPAFSGAGYRTALWFATVLVASLFTMWYARKVSNDPQKSLTYHIDISDFQNSADELANVRLSVRDVFIIITFVMMFVGVALGPRFWGWTWDNRTACFLFCGIIAGLIARFDMDKLVSVFVKGCGGIMMAVLFVSIGRAVQVLMSDAKILDTIVQFFAAPIAKLPPSLAAIGMCIVQSIINFFIPSGSGQCAVTMPIMSQLADFANITRQTAIMAFSIGDGFTNIMYPTVGAIMAMLAVAKVEWNIWIKYAWKFVACILAVGFIFLIIATKIQWGPF